jgi:hypothetical protein
MRGRDMNLNQRKLVFELKAVLEQQVALLDNLLEIMQDERELLVQFQPDQLVEINKRKELLVLQQSYLEANRKSFPETWLRRWEFRMPNPPWRSWPKMSAKWAGC